MSESLSKLQNFFQEVGELQTNALTVSKKLLDNGKKEEVSLALTKKLVMPERMESPARGHVFHDSEGFVEYLKRNKKPAMLVMADVAGVQINAVLDDNAKKGFEVIKLVPPYDPRYALLEETLLDKELMPITEFARNVMRNRPIILEGMQTAMMMNQITVASKITACVGSGKKAVNGVMCTTEVKSGVGEEVVELPDSLEVDLPIYLRTEKKRFSIDLTLTANRSGEVLVTTDSPEVEVKKFEVFERMLEPIKKINGILITYGQPSTKSWIYNK